MQLRQPGAGVPPVRHVQPAAGPAAPLRYIGQLSTAQQMDHHVWAYSASASGDGLSITALSSAQADHTLCTAGLATCAFWGYCVGHGALALGHALLEASRLPIVFDLDETLLVAYSLHTLDVRLAKLRAAR